ncbi:hypothetical protein V6R21_08040 [Limibacter armeniacum]|uniref:hypothetical protein n=1 Tax=Limibacter armeniacum TaxID=466084 RepID=UPI002FE67057
MKYWVSKSGNDKLIVVSDDVIYNFNPGLNQLYLFEEELRQGKIPKKLTGTPLSYIRSISSKVGSPKIQLNYGKDSELLIHAGEHKKEIFSYLKDGLSLQPKYVLEEESFFTRAKNPLIMLLITLGVVIFSYDYAKNMELGYTYEIRGRIGVLGGLSLGLAEILGSEGVLFFGTLISGISTVFIWKAFRNKGFIEKLIYKTN